MTPAGTTDEPEVEEIEYFTSQKDGDTVKDGK